jgi:hypothetical protein
MQFSYFEARFLTAPKMELFRLISKSVADKLLLTTYLKLFK